MESLTLLERSRLDLPLVARIRTGRGADGSRSAKGVVDGVAAEDEGWVEDSDWETGEDFWLVRRKASAKTKQTEEFTEETEIHPGVDDPKIMRDEEEGNARLFWVR